jgi:thiol-disulfide isomerase/thioredoxin
MYMQKRIIFLFILLYVSTLSLAQRDADARGILAAWNQQIAAVEQGYFDCSYIHKSMMDKDSSSHSGRTYFFKKKADKDSIGQFIVELSPNSSKCYDGSTIYYVNHEGKSIETRPIEEKGNAVRFLSGGRQGYIALLNYLYVKSKPAFTKFLEHPLLDTLQIDGQSMLRITCLDSFPNPLKTLPKDPDWSQLRIEYDLSIPDLILRTRREWVYINGMEQYLEQHLSPIHPLPDTYTFDDMLHIDSLVASGYTLKGSTPIVYEPLIQKGEILPEIALPDLEGNLVKVTDFDKGVILLDFWYKNCGPCLLAMPIIEKLHQKYQNQGLHVIGVDPYDKDTAELKAFLLDREITYPTIIDSTKQISRALHIRSYPSLILVDAITKRVLHTEVGFNKDMLPPLEALIEQYIKQ